MNAYIVLEMRNDDIVNVTTYTEDKKQEAEDYFREIASDADPDLTESELEIAVIDGYYEQDEWIVRLLTSELV